MGAPGEDSDPVSALQRWHASGALWRVTARKSSEITVALFRCDGGEEVDRLTSGDPRWLAFLNGRSSSED